MGEQTLWVDYEFGPKTNISGDPTVRHTWWGLVFGGCFIQLTLYAVNQVQVQRLLTVKDLRASQKAVFLSWPLLSFLSLCTSYSGLVIYSEYFKCDPVTSGQISSTDQLMPLYVMETLSYIPSLAGLFTAGVFSGSLSSVSSALNSLAAVTLEDYLKPLHVLIMGKPVPETHLGVVVKLIALAFGVVCIAMAFIAEFLGGILQASYTLFGVIGGPLLGTFSLGMFTTFANETGAISGLLFGIATMIWIGFGGPRPVAEKLYMSLEECGGDNITTTTYPPLPTTTDPLPQEEYFYLYRISYMWYSIMGFCITFIVGAIVSLLVMRFNKTPQAPVDPDLLTPIARYYVIKYRAKNKSLEKPPKEKKISLICNRYTNTSGSFFNNESHDKTVSVNCEPDV